MAKVSFTKLGLKSNNEIVNIEFNGQIIEVKQYLPVQDKLELIGKVLELSHDSNNFSNPVKIQVYTALEIIEKYTNISFTEKQKENLPKLYDVLNSNGLIEQVVGAIPQGEYDVLIHGVYDTVDAVYKYQNSILGILDSISQDYSNLNLDIENIKDKLTNPEQIALLKELAKISGFYEN